MKERVRQNTAEKINKSIDQKTKQSIELHLSQDKDALNNRMKELEKEWDIERVLEVNMPVVALAGLSLGIFVNQWWFAFPVLVLLFFLQHAIQGWCPPLPIFRRLGYRTKMEIEKERYALKFLRGDFDELFKDKIIEGAQVYKAVSKT